MRFSLLFILLLLAIEFAFSQSDTLINSFEIDYKTLNPKINYSYDNENQIHNYSNNWDFDLDGKTDEIYFIGTGGVHLYYFLRIVLSHDKIVRNYPFIESDLPILPSDKEMENSDYNPIKCFTHFAVYDFDKNNIKDIFIRLDDTTLRSSKKALKRNKLKTNYIVLTFKNNRMELQDFQLNLK
jgi:hypothetical protein